MNKKYNSILYCIICGKKFDDNIVPSKEHIIPEALGNEKIVTYNVCEDCNNQLGTHVDSYLTDHFVVRAIRKQKLSKDNDIQIFNDTLENDRGEKYKIREEGPQVIPRIVERDDTHVRIVADPREAKKFATRVLKKKYKMDKEDIDKILNDPNRYTVSQKEDITPGAFTQDISLDKSRYLLAAIKMGYEYACEKLGDVYLQDNVAQNLRAYLYVGRKGKRDFSDDEYREISKYCQVDGLRPEGFRFCGNELQVIDNYVPYLLFITSDMENKMVCCIRILNEDMLSFDILLSEDASKYMQKGESIISFVTNKGELIEI